MSYRIGIDIGGTFTDFALFDADARSLAIHKQLTTPDDPSRAVIEGVTTLLADNGGRFGDRIVQLKYESTTRGTTREPTRKPGDVPLIVPASQ